MLQPYTEPLDPDNFRSISYDGRRIIFNYEEDIIMSQPFQLIVHNGSAIPTHILMNVQTLNTGTFTLNIEPDNRSIPSEHIQAYISGLSYDHRSLYITEHELQRLLELRPISITTQ
jgi:hypothetical protein